MQLYVDNLFILEHLQCILKCSIDHTLSLFLEYEHKKLKKRRREVGWAEIIEGLPGISDTQGVISKFENLAPVTPELFMKLPQLIQDWMVTVCGVTGWRAQLVQQINLVSNRVFNCYQFLIVFTITSFPIRL